MSDDFMRHCDEALNTIFDQDAEDCLNSCSQNQLCKKAHWHPAGQIWWGDHSNADRTVCWLWYEESQTCVEAGWSIQSSSIGAHPGAQMIECYWCKCFMKTFCLDKSQ